MPINSMLGPYWLFKTVLYKQLNILKKHILFIPYPYQVGAVVGVLSVVF